MDYSLPVGTLSTHQEIGSIKYTDELYPYVVEKNTHEINHEVPRIFYRVLFEHRLDDGEKLTFEYLDYGSKTVDEIKSELKSHEFASSGVTFIHCPPYKTLKTPIKTTFSSIKYEPNDLINKFIASKPEAFASGNDNSFMYVFACPEKKSAVVIGTQSAGAYPWNVAAALSSKFMPWYFEDKPLTDDEKNLIFAIDQNPEAFIAAAQVLYNKSTAKSKIESLHLKEMFYNAKSAMICRFNDTIADYSRKMSDCTAIFENCAKQIHDASVQKEALMNSENEYSEAFSNLMTKNPHIKIISWYGDVPTFEIGGYNLQVSHPDALERDIDIQGRGVYTNSPNGIPFEWKKRLIESVFLDHEINISVCSTFVFNMERNYIRCTGMGGPPSAFIDSIYNPHHHYYNCLGNNEPKIAEYLAKGDYVNAIVQTQGCVPFWNVGDSAVTEQFTRNELWNRAKRIFKLPDGAMVNYEDAIKWLQTKDEEEKI